jgi:RNA polymerase sigma factor (sigma-70 family)
MSISDINFREGVYRQIYEGAYAVARAQQPDIASHAEDIAQSVVLKFTKRQMTNQVENPFRWGAVHARHACVNFANRQLPRARAENVWEDNFWEERVDVNPEIYPYKMIAGADAIAYALSCLSDRERQMVHLVEAGYSHAEIAEMMGYANARTVTTTWNRVKSKIFEHVGGRDELLDLLGTDVLAIRLPPDVITGADQHGDREAEDPTSGCKETP